DNGFLAVIFDFTAWEDVETPILFLELR
ncbi:hypothetical protein C5S31_02580, partial [ANME-1 cluster archaeon GoMg2]|nr:hypothetical protein [ANME-1 cluster archaeon GoMg2]